MNAARRTQRPLAVLALLFAGSPLALAQPPSPAAERPPSLRARLGVEAARALLANEDARQRRRGLERLGQLGTSAALELLAGALAPGGAARSPRERLVAVRALAPHARHEVSRSALVRAMGGALTRDEPLETLVRLTAALALGAAEHPAAERALSQALRQPGRVAEAARLALGAHPPRTLDAVLAGRGVPTVALAGLLGDLGRTEGVELAFGMTRAGPPAVRAEALSSLAKLAPQSAAEVALRFRQTEKHRILRAAAARTLARLGHREAPAALSELLVSPGLEREALAIAAEFPSAALGAELAKRRLGDRNDLELWLSALGRAGGRAPLERLGRELRDPAHGWAAAYSLALCPDHDADQVLERALREPLARRNAARAGAVRERMLERSIDGLGATLDALARSATPADRAAAAFGRAVLDVEAGQKLVAARDSATVLAAARAALDPELAPAAARRLAAEADPELSTALAVSLADPKAQDLVPDRVLFALLEARGPAAHLAAYALAARDNEAKRPRLRELLASGDPLLRAHVALGLARSLDPTAVGLLDDAYRFESNPTVRRAIVNALSARSERGRLRTLELAARLEPDELARNAARRALTRGGSQTARLPESAAWLRVRAEPGSAAEEWFAVLLVETGLALPLASDPDGSVVVVGLPPGELSLALAPATPGGDASTPRSP